MGNFTAYNFENFTTSAGMMRAAERDIVTRPNGTIKIYKTGCAYWTWYLNEDGVAIRLGSKDEN